MRVALVSLACENDLTRADIFSYMPPLGMMYLAKWLKMCRIPGLEIVIVDEKELEERYEDGGCDGIERSGPPIFWRLGEYDVVGIGLWATTYKRALWLAEKVKRQSPSTYIVGGGPMAGRFTALPEGFDCIVIGCGYGPLEKMARGERPSGIVSGGMREPAITLPPEAAAYKVGALMASYGCPFRCHFCESRFLKGFQYRDISCITADLNILMGPRGPAYFEFFDNIMFLHPEIATILQAIGGRKPWGAILDCRRRTRDFETIGRAVDAGLLTLGLGIESTDNAVLRGINKGHTQTSVRMTVRALGLLQKRGLRVHAFMMYGLPRQTMASAEVDLVWLDRHGIASQWSRLRVVKSTWLSHHYKRVGLELREDGTVCRTRWASERELDDFDRMAVERGMATRHQIWGDIFAKVKGQ